MTRGGSPKIRWLFDRVRTLFRDVQDNFVKEEPNVGEPLWESQDHVKPVSTESVILDPWEGSTSVELVEAKSSPKFVQREEEELFRDRIDVDRKDRPDPAQGEENYWLDSQAMQAVPEWAEEQSEVIAGGADQNYKSKDYVEADIEYLEYDPNARQLPWAKSKLEEDFDTDLARRAREKASAIASDVEVTTRRELEDLLTWLTQLFLRFEHPATFRAIRRVVEQGITSELLRAVVAFRDCWMQRREWWVGRFGRSRELRAVHRGAGGLTWAAAARVCRCRADYAPEDMIDENWFDEWLNLVPSAPGYFLFAEYVDAKVTQPDLEMLHVGLLQLEDSDGCEEIGEARGWWRMLPRYDEDVRFSFNVLTPFRDGFGAPGYPENQDPPRRANNDT